VTALALFYIAGAVATVGALVLLDRQRRRFLGGVRQNPRVHHSTRGATGTQASAAGAAVRRSVVPVEPAMPADLPTDADEAMVYIDASGRCTFSNASARDLFNCKGGDVILSDALQGGHEELHALLEVLKREGVVAQHPTALAAPWHTPLEISGLALRDQNGGAWRAALFIHRRTTPDLLRGALP